MNNLSDTPSYYSFNPHATDTRGPKNATRRLMFGWITGGVSAAVKAESVPYWQSAHSLMRTVTVSGTSLVSLLKADDSLLKADDSPLKSDDSPLKSDCENRRLDHSAARRWDIRAAPLSDERDRWADYNYTSANNAGSHVRSSWRW